MSGRLNRSSGNHIRAKEQTIGLAPWAVVDADASDCRKQTLRTAPHRADGVAPNSPS